MHRRVLLWFLIATAQMGLCRAADPPRLQIRLQNHLTSYASRPGSPFKCVVICPFEVGGRILIPEASTVYGTVRQAVPVHLGLVRERAALDLNFSEYQTPDGQRFLLRATLASIDNAREEVTPKGRIKGVLAATNPDEMLGGIWEKPSLDMLYRPLEGVTGVAGEILDRFPMGPVGPAVLLGVRCLLLRFPEPEIYLPPGTDMELTVDESSTDFAPRPAPPVPNAPAELAQWLGARPFRVEKPSGRRVDDVINVAFMGSAQQLSDAFHDSGWYAAEQRTFGSLSRSYIAFNVKKTYPTAPVSKLLYQGKPPDLVFEKSLDTICKRHHVRIWNAGSFEGQDIWLGAATHDTGVEFNRRTFLLTHRIDKNLDAERDKIAVDLNFAGCSQSVSYTPADGAHTADLNPSVVTDGRVAIFSLQACSQTEHPDADSAPPPPGNKVSRLIRRVVLESRSYILRENVYYWAYEFIRHH
ncbi:MAG: LssY C-terminal domain-containing protein [Acidobacteriaceae bacterium]|nr:LssY C-terminal domain-containing protein [Acidobacteriaceae bacterium]